jgi:NADPH:quinone reductase-like Zn-dependent oxidoreductase
MRAAAFTELTGPDGVGVIEQETPEPGADGAVIDVEACSINRHDLWILDGDSAMVDGGDLPFVSGLDVAGTVREVGAAVRDVEPGDRVVLCPNETCGSCQYCREGPENLCERFSLFHGGLAETARVPADRLLALPEGVTPVEAAAVPTAYMTAYHMFRQADLEVGDRVFVPGATGGVGVATVQIADALGLESVGTSSSGRKLDRVRELGLDRGVESTDIDTIREAVDGRFDAVFNHLGGAYTGLGQSVLRRGGTMVVCGRTAGGESTVQVADLFLQHKRVVGSTMGTQGDLRRLLGLVADGEVDPVVDETYPLGETDAAFAAMQDRDQVGKLVVRPQQ